MQATPVASPGLREPDSFQVSLPPPSVHILGCKAHRRPGRALAASASSCQGKKWEILKEQRVERPEQSAVPFERGVFPSFHFHLSVLFIHLTALL